MQQNNIMAMMVSLQRRLDHRSDDNRERQFFSHTLEYLTTASGRQVEMENWMITPYEVEFGPLIGSGGLYVVCSLCSSSYSRADFGYQTADKCSWGHGMRLKSHSKF
jgi:hypothetical protein